MNSIVIDRTLVERMVMGFREQEAVMPGFEIQGVAREVCKLEWKFRRYVAQLGWFSESSLWFEGAEIIRMGCPPFQVEPGDTIKFTYTLTWWWEGGDDDKVTRHPFPVPGAKIQFEFALAA